MPTYRTDVKRHGYPGHERPRRHQKHRESVMTANDSICHICEKRGADAIDHIVPVAWGGSDEIANLAPAHTSCNSSKGASKNTGPDGYTWHHPEMWMDGYGPKWNPDADVEDMEDIREGIGARYANTQYRYTQPPTTTTKAKWNTGFYYAICVGLVFMLIAIVNSINSTGSMIPLYLFLTLLPTGILGAAITSAPKKSNYR